MLQTWLGLHKSVRLTENESQHCATSVMLSVITLRLSSVGLRMQQLLMLHGAVGLGITLHSSKPRVRAHLVSQVPTLAGRLVLQNSLQSYVRLQALYSLLLKLRLSLVLALLLALVQP